MSFNNIRDEKVKKLAETLRSSGLAASDTEAIRMAEEMSSTADKVQDGYNTQSEISNRETVNMTTNDLNEMDGSSTMVKDIVKNVENMEQQYNTEDSDLTPTSSNIDVDKLFNEQKEVLNSSYGSDKTVNELMSEDSKPLEAPIEATPEVVPEVVPEPIVEQVSEPVVETVQEVAAPEIEQVSAPIQQEEVTVNEPELEVPLPSENEVANESVQEPISEQTQTEPEMFKEDDFEVEKTKEIPAEEELSEADIQRKKEYQKSQECEMDLSDVFNFSKK